MFLYPYNHNQEDTNTDRKAVIHKKGSRQMYNELIREATTEEMAIYEKVETILDTLSEEEEENFIETVGNRIFRTFDEATDKAIYNKVYRLGKKYGLTVEELETWYCIDAY